MLARVTAKDRQMRNVAADGEARRAVLRVTDDALPRQTVDGRNIGNLQRRLAAQLRHALISHAVAYNDQILHNVL